MDFEKIITELELGKPLSKIAKELKISLTEIYKKLREDEELQKKVRAARETGCFTIIDQINEMLETPQDNQHMMWVREKIQQSRWLASKLAAGVFGDKQKHEVKQDTTLTVSWGRPTDEKLIKKIEKPAIESTSTNNEILP